MSIDALHHVSPERKHDRKGAFRRYLARFDDGEIMRWAFGGLLIGAVGVLATDLKTMIDARQAMNPPAQQTVEVVPRVLPPAVATGGLTPRQTIDPREFVTADAATLQQPMRFSLRSHGVLQATGTIDPGSTARLKQELDARGEYIRTVSLNSPGGSIDDAIAMARLVREHGVATEVASGAICASSCPLFLAGGVVRSVGSRAAIGIHQFYSGTKSSEDAAQAMADAQLATARIATHLKQMGVDPLLWLNALATPPRTLYYLTRKEMADYRLVTTSSVARGDAAARS